MGIRNGAFVGLEAVRGVCKSGDEVHEGVLSTGNRKHGMGICDIEQVGSEAIRVF